MQICIFSRPFFPAVGGLERMAFTLASEFANAGHSVEVVTDTPHSSEKEEFQEFRITRTTSLIQRYRAFQRADAILLMNISLIGGPLALLTLRNVAVSHQGTYGTRAFGWRIYWREKLKHHSTRLFTNIACSTYVASKLPVKASVIPNAYDDALFTKNLFVEKSRDFVFCGRLVSDKGADVAISAFSTVLQDHPSATLTVIGDGPERKQLEKLVGTLGCGHAVKFAGMLQGAALRESLESHRCMVVPSLWAEPFGIVALEGLACCSRVIVSRRGGLPEAVGICGITVEPSITEFAIAMHDVIDLMANESDAERAEFERQRESHLQKHRGRAIALRYLEILEAPRSY